MVLFVSAFLMPLMAVEQQNFSKGEKYSQKLNLLKGFLKKFSRAGGCAVVI